MDLFTVVCLSLQSEKEVSEVHILDCRTAGMPSSLIHTSRPREPMQWMWYGTPPACTHPLWQEGGGEGRTYEGRGRYNVMKMGEGTGCLALSSLLSSFHCSSYMPACVCICAHTGLQHMHDRHVTSSRGLHFKTFTKPKAESIMGAKLRKKINRKPTCLGSIKGSRTSLSHGGETLNICTNGCYPSLSRAFIFF